MAEAIGLGFGALVLFVALLGLLGTLFWIWMLVDCVRKEPTEGNDRIVWVLIIVLLHLLGAIVYFFVRKLPRAS
jgi:hypothetical protein